MATDCLHIDKTGLIYYISAFQNVFLVYHCHNTKHVGVPVVPANINANFQDIGVPERFSNLATSERQRCEKPRILLLLHV